VPELNTEETERWMNKGMAAIHNRASQEGRPYYSKMTWSINIWNAEVDQEITYAKADFDTSNPMSFWLHKHCHIL